MPTSKRKASGIKRTEIIGVRVTPSQKRAIEEAAKRVALDPSTWLRMVGLERAAWNPADEDAGSDGPTPKKV